MTADPIALAKVGEWTSICGDPPELLVRELAEVGFVIVPRAAVATCVAEMEHYGWPYGTPEAWDGFMEPFLTSLEAPAEGA